MRRTMHLVRILRCPARPADWVIHFEIRERGTWPLARARTTEYRARGSSTVFRDLDTGRRFGTVIEMELGAWAKMAEWREESDRT